jgi:glycosyltransferase involved in cell wall biosynthesis
LIRVVEAVSELPVTLVIIGPLNDLQRAQLTRLGVPYENHLDLGRDELRDQYRRADAVVFASTYEGFGLPIIEAQAIGRPVVTSNICSMPEAAGGAACLVNPLDVADIRRGIRRLLNDAEYCDELVSRGRTNASLYSPARIAGEYANVYRNAYERAKRSK